MSCLDEVDVYGTSSSVSASALSTPSLSASFASSLMQYLIMITTGLFCAPPTGCCWVGLFGRGLGCHGLAAPLVHHRNLVLT